jgi:hypothetical protein
MIDPRDGALVSDDESFRIAPDLTGASVRLGPTAWRRRLVRQGTAWGGTLTGTRIGGAGRGNGKRGITEAKSLAKAGREIEAIRRYRSITGAGLKDAKEFVDRLL